MGAKVRRPVWWPSRLRVADDVHYTEVAAQPVVVRADTADVVTLGTGTAQLLIRLDGRPLTDVLAGELDTWDDDERHRIHALLRWCKAMGIVEDADPDAPTAPPAWDQTPGPCDTIEIAGHLVAAPHVGGDGVNGTAPPGRTVLVVHADHGENPPGAPDTENGGGPDDHDGPGTDIATVTVHLDDPGGVSPDALVIEHGDLDGATTPTLAAFVALVRATTPRARLGRPGVIDTLATIAETCTVQTRPSTDPTGTPTRNVPAGTPHDG